MTAHRWLCLTRNVSRHLRVHSDRFPHPNKNDMKRKYRIALGVATVTTVILAGLALQRHSRERPQLIPAQAHEEQIDDLVQRRIQSEFSDRAALMSMLQEKGMTVAEYRQQVEQEIKAHAPGSHADQLDELVRQRIQSAYRDRTALISMLQEKGMTFAEYRQQVEQEIRVETQSTEEPAR